MLPWLTCKLMVEIDTNKDQGEPLSIKVIGEKEEGMIELEESYNIE